eukprot:gene31567-19227_t
MRGATARAAGERRCALPVKAFITLTAVTSTAVSVALGLYLAADVDGAVRVVAGTYDRSRHAARYVEAALRSPPAAACGGATAAVLAALSEQQVERALLPAAFLGDLQHVTVFVAASDPVRVRNNRTALYAWLHRELPLNGGEKWFFGRWSPEMGLVPAKAVGMTLPWGSPYVVPRQVEPGTQDGCRKRAS